jgi:signal transduction histidine kinase
MAVTYKVLLLTLESMFQLDILAWIIGLPLLVGAVWLLVRQYRQYHTLRNELGLLKQVKRHSIEYEMVIKAMKLCIWRIDVPTHEVTFDCDYRDFTDNYTPPQHATMEDVINQILPDYRETITEGFLKVMNGEQDDFHMQYQMTVPDSDKSYWSEGFITIEKRGLDGKPLTIVGTSMRIDQQKQIEQALMDAVYHAEESDRLKSAFLANISHEIRTPLNAIVGFSEVLPMAEDEEERQHLVGLIRQSNTQLLRLFDDIVSMSKLEARGGGEINKSSFVLKTLLMELQEKYAATAKEKGLALLIEIADDRSFISTDRDRLREILNQYINNALKFTKRGQVTLGCTDMGDNWRIWVRDTGKGIPANKCDDTLFDRFVKVDEFTPGTGLGLSICRSLALTLDGTVGVESTLGMGSFFWVELKKE